ncbi:MAG TPA: ABC transporter substrate-binding protein [Alphaproteobacteria bacterium]|nr:ABC transporter substrate-binding protein [Alphaproteobacteria bacterium]
MKKRTLQVGLLGAAMGAALTIGTCLAQAAQVIIPILVPITGFLSLEGNSQRNGAVLALEHAPPGVKAKGEVLDTGTSPEIAVNAFEKAVSAETPIAIVAPILGIQMLAILPLANQHKVPLVTVSGTAKITELSNPYIFRFFPADNVVKVVQARYAVETLGKKRPALLFQTTAYGQSGEAVLTSEFNRLGAPLVFEDSLDTNVKDMLPILLKVREANPDVLVLQLHAGSMALVVKEAASMNLPFPIVASSAMHQPSTAALLEPDEMKGVCAETGSSPISSETPAVKKWLAEYRSAFQTDPDAYALGQYDGVAMVLKAVEEGAKTPEDVRAYLATKSFKGIAMTYKSDGVGNMAHSAEIVCYDGKTRIPKVVKRYDNVDAAP